MKKKPLTQEEVDAMQEREAQLVGPSNGITATTWVFCWKCGKKLNVKNKKEVTSGVHSRCDNYFFPPLAISIGDCSEFPFNENWRHGR